MTQTATQLETPFDPMDTRIELTAVLEREIRLLDQVKLMSLQKGRKDSVHVASMDT
jgi:hypothetical protein